MLIVFDWDGTLIDSTDKIVGCMHMAVAEVGLSSLRDGQVKNIIGLGLPEAMRELFPAAADAALTQLRESYARHFVAADQVPCPFYPGVESVLGQLRSDGHLLAVATGKSRRGLNRVLANLNLSAFFDGSRCADETASKPSPLMLEQLLDQFDMAKEAAVMVGDTEFDLEMATNAGMRSIAVSYGAHSQDRLLKHSPAMLIDQMEELLAWEGLH